MAERPTLTRGRGSVPVALDRPVRGELVLEGPLKDTLGERRIARLVPRGEGAVVRANLGRSAPPGLHKAILKTAEGEVPVTIEVPERLRLRLRPSSVDVAGQPGGKASVELAVENRGNVAASLPATGVAGLFASDGVAGAFSRAYGTEGDDPMQIFGAFVTGLRRSYLGLMHLKLSGVEKPISPGERRTLIAELAIPKAPSEATQAGKGRRFHATFTLGGARLTVRLTIA